MKSIRDDLPRLKQALFYTLIFSLAAHAYMYFTFAPSHDALYAAVAGERETVWQISLGRFMQPLYWLVRGRFTAPWLVGMLSVLFLGASVYLIVRMLDIKNRLSLILLCGIFSTNLTVTASNATYLPWADIYMLALLLACGGAYMWERYAKWGPVLAVPFLACSMGFYQAYIDVAIGLALILLIRRVAEGESFLLLWRRAVRYAVSLLGGAAAYFIVMKFVLRLTGVAMSDAENGLAKLFASDFGSLLRLVPAAYFDFAAVLLSPFRSYNSALICVCTALALAAGALLWIHVLRRRHIQGLALAAFFLCAALLPLGLNFVYILAVGDIHLLMMFSYFLVYAVLLLPLEARETLPAAGLPRPISLCRKAVLLFCGVMVFRNIVFANGAYYKKQVIFESTSQYAYSIVETIEKNPDYEPGVTPVAVIGEFTGSYLERSTEDFPQYRNVTGMWNGTSITYPESFASYCANVLGHPINLIRDETELTEIAVRSATREMPVFPKEGYCRMIDGVMVVKLTDSF